MMPAGPQGRVSVTNGIVAAANSSSPHPDAVHKVLAWMGSTDGNSFLGRSGSAIPAVLSARAPYFQYWADKGVDVSPSSRCYAVSRSPPPVDRASGPDSPR